MFAQHRHLVVVRNKIHYPVVSGGTALVLLGDHDFLDRGDGQSFPRRVERSAYCVSGGSSIDDGGLLLVHCHTSILG